MKRKINSIIALVMTALLLATDLGGLPVVWAAEPDEAVSENEVPEDAVSESEIEEEEVEIEDNEDTEHEVEEAEEAEEAELEDDDVFEGFGIGLR